MVWDPNKPEEAGIWDPNKPVEGAGVWVPKRGDGVCAPNNPPEAAAVDPARYKLQFKRSKKFKPALMH